MDVSRGNAVPTKTLTRTSHDQKGKNYQEDDREEEEESKILQGEDGEVGAG